MIDVATAEDTACIVMGLSGAPAATLETLDILEQVPADRFATSLDEAKEIAQRLLGE